MMIQPALTMEDLRWLRALGKQQQKECAPAGVLSKLLALKLAAQGISRIELTAKGRIAVKILG
jgi:hypothetical protein